MKIDQLRRGAAAGAIGATVVVIWFLTIDLGRGDPFATPEFVASSLLGDSALAALPAWTALHYLAFMAVGVAAASVTRRLQVAAPTLLGLALGFLLFDIVFYGSILSTGSNVVAELGWPTVLVGNFLAGLAVTHTLHLTGTEGRTWLTRALQGPVVREGIKIGVIGGLAVALWFLAIDALQGAVLRTPSTLGGLVLAGETDAATMAVDLGWVAAYTVLHFAVFTVIGVMLAGVADSSDERPPLVIGAFLAFVAFEAFAMGIVALLAELMPHAWWTMVGANLLAAVAMGALLYARHPVMGRGLMDDEVLARAE